MPKTAVLENVLQECFICDKAEQQYMYPGTQQFLVHHFCLLLLENFHVDPCPVLEIAHKSSRNYLLLLQCLFSKTVLIE